MELKSYTDFGREMGRVVAMLTHILNDPSRETRKFLIHIISQDSELSDTTKSIILDNLKELEPEVKQKDDRDYQFSLNESVKKNFNRLINK